MGSSPARFLLILTLLIFKNGLKITWGEEKILSVGTLLPLSNHWWQSYGLFYVDFLKWAFEEIGKRTDILPGYKLALVQQNTQGEAGLAAKRMFELFSQNSTIIAVIGAGLSDELSLTGQIAQFYNVPVLSFAATTSHSLERKKYRAVYITNYLGESVNVVRLAMMRAFNWTHVATFVFKDDVFLTQIDNFHRLLAENSKTLVTSAVVTDLTQISEHMIRIKQYNARIIMGAFRSNQAPYIFCEAYKHGVYGQTYQWILTGSSMYDGWIKSYYSNISAEKVLVECTREQLVEASKNYFVVDNVYLRPDDNLVTISRKTTVEYNAQVNAMANESPYSIPRSHPYGYDAVWALALALNRTQDKLKQGTLGATSLEDFNYTRGDMFDLMLECLQETSFEGVSGLVSFNGNGQRLGPHLIARFYNDTKMTVGSFDSHSELLWRAPISILFEGGRPPRDQLSYVTKRLPSNTGAVAVTVFINSTGLVIAVGFLGFNIAYRNNRHIKMSSPNINNTIVLGCLLMYAFVYVLTFDYADWMWHNSDNICMVRTWLACIGFTLSFGALFAKTWRVYALFRNKEIHRKVIKDALLLSHVAVLVMVDIVILVPWSTVHPLVKKDYRSPAEGESTDDVLVTYVHTGCAHKHEMYWYMAEYVYKGLLLAFGAFLAWETRMVTIPALNDSKLIGFCIYNIGIVCAFVVPVTNVLAEDMATLTFLLVAIFASLCTSLVLCILFIPKVRLRNQVTGKRFVATLNSTAANGGTAVQEASQQGRQSLHLPTSPSVQERGSTKGASLVLQVPRETNSTRLFTIGTSISATNFPEHNKEPGQTDIEQELQAEVRRLNIKLAQEMQAITKLKSMILKESNQQLNFQNIGQEYMVFKTTLSKTQLDNDEECGESVT